MTCRFCGREVPDNSIFCNWCGERQLRERKKKDEIRVPTPRQLPSGSWNIVLRAEGQSVTEPTRERCLARARAIRAGFLEARKTPSSQPLGVLIDQYIADQRPIRSPSTIVGYENIRRKRFPDLMGTPVNRITSEAWRRAIDAEQKMIGRKTLKNAWGLVSAALNARDIDLPDIVIPRAVSKEREWLDFEQIQQFLIAVRGTDVEVAALLALLSLRRSEICALQWEDIDLRRGVVHVRGSLVDASHGEWVLRADTKTEQSTREVPILIPRLADLLAEQRQGSGAVFSGSPRTIAYRINRICTDAQLPHVGTHGLRHSFASLAYHVGMPEAECMQIGGWSNIGTMRKIYTHIASQDKERHARAMRDFYENAHGLQTPPEKP